jgi:nucleoside-triphosphatase THEP1
MSKEPTAKIIVITGEKGCGKTTLCEWCASEFQSRKLDVAGLISITNNEDHQKTKIKVRDIRSGESHVLAERLNTFDLSSMTPRWKFDPRILEWGNKQLNTTVPCDLLIIDELGLMEFNHQKGWMNAFPILIGKKYQLAVVVIRPQLLSQAHEILGEFHIFEVDEKDRNTNRKKLDEIVSENLDSNLSEH